MERNQLINSDQLIDLTRVRALARQGTARAIRLSAGLSLAEVAKAVGVSATTVYHWETGENAPHGYPALRYKELLDRLVADDGKVEAGVGPT